MELPQFSHKKEYSNYFLLDDSEVILNNDFNRKIRAFSKNLNSEKIFIELELTKEFEQIIQEKFISIPIEKHDTLDFFFSKEIEYGNGNILNYFVFNFHMFDETSDWELYCSHTQEIAIFGCNYNVMKDFNKFFDPYDEVTLKEKLNNITKRFKDYEIAKEYIFKLTNNYKFADKIIYG